jgi:hypothetical protein
MPQNIRSPKVIKNPLRQTANINLHDWQIEVGEKHGSIVGTQTVFISIGLSLGYHFLLFGLFYNRVSFNLAEFWGFIFSDVCLACLAFVPIIAVWKRQLAWYDPFSLFAIFFISMTGVFYPAYLVDPDGLRIISAYGGSGIDLSSEAGFLLLAIKSECILGLFFIVILATNHRTLQFHNIKLSKCECKAALLTMILCLAGGIIGFVTYWKSLGDFILAMTVNIGTAETLPDPGTSRYLILVFIAVVSVSLGLVGWLGRMRKAKRRAIMTDFIVLLAGGACALVNAWNASRLDVLFAFLTIIVVLELFGFRTRRYTWLAIVSFLIATIGLLTVLRGNRFLGSDPSSVIMQIQSGEVARSYSDQIVSNIQTLLGLDRISVLVMVIAYLNSSGSFLLGESLIAGPVNIISGLLSRFAGESQAGEYSRGFLAMANETITYWRYGNAAYGGVPPSIPGEFYMQFGILSLLVLSIIFGLVFYWLRTKISHASSLIGRWSIIIIIIGIVKLLGAEISVFADTFIYYSLPVILVYFIVYALLRINKLSMEKNI